MVLLCNGYTAKNCCIPFCGKKCLYAVKIIAEDFLVRGMLYYNEIWCNEISGNIDSRVGLKNPKRILKRLYIIC